MVIVAAGCVLLLMGVFGKIGAAFATIPTPVIGGMFFIMFGLISAVGISNLQVRKARHPEKCGSNALP
jgi:nucleobase transporter 1/2